MRNARDLGGLPLRSGSVAPGVVVRSETVVNLTALGAQQLRELGVGHVLDLRSDEEQERDGDGELTAAFDRSQLVRERIPFGDGPGGLPSLFAATPEEVSGRWSRWLEQVSFRLAEALAHAAWSTTPVLVCSATGSERASVVTAMLLELAGAEERTIVDDHLASAPFLPTVVAELSRRPAYADLALLPADRFTPSARTMGLLLRELRAWGGTRGWLLQHGADPETIDLLRVRLTGERMSVRQAG
jgi:protein-tyrosine phosphatase